MTGYEFKGFSNLKNIVTMHSIEENVDFIYEFFMQNEADILYIMGDEKLEAIASPGDVHKFYIGEGEYDFPINKNFLCLDEVDYNRARQIFESIPTIHEIPVIINGKFEGVVTDNLCKNEMEWKDIRDDLNRCKTCKVHTEWLCKDLLKWKKYFPDVKLFIYYIPSDKYLMPEVLKERKLRSNGKYDERNNAEQREGFTRLEFDKMHLLHNNGIYKFGDMDTDTCKISNGNRNVPNVIADAIHKVFVFGPCTMFGGYVDDSSTVEYFLQEKINKEGKSYQICNCSMLGPEYCHHRMFTEDMGAYDIVILALREADFPLCYFDPQIRENFQCDLSVLFDKQKDAQKMFLACPAHCNDVINKKIADVFYEDIKSSLTDEKSTAAKTAIQDYYVGFAIRDYFVDFIKKYKSTDLRHQDVIGSIVMNCNPFTLGHRFLINSALEKTDFLYIFVVEENKSFFPFEDRVQMVKDGVKDLERVAVIPSGKYIISKDTFAQYFEKENVTEIENMDYDVRIFGELVAPGFHILHRFIGEEPTDSVTNQYNVTLKNILPQYGVKVHEIPRINVKGRKEVINATAVRNLVKLRRFDELKQYCPESTISHLKKYNQEMTLHKSYVN